MTEKQTRLHALDAIRGIALLLGLVLHGSMSFWPGLSDYGFPISDSSKSMVLTYLFYVLHMFRMAVFFLIAGFFAHLSLHRKGSRDFLKDRLKRIALPMGVAWVISLPLILPTIIWAAGKFYGQPGTEFLAGLQEDAPPQPLLMHFWFLYYLLWFYVLAVLCVSIARKLDPESRFMSCLDQQGFFLYRTGLLFVTAALFSTLVFFLRDNWEFWAGIPTPTEAIWNEAPAFLIYGLAFMVGWFLDRERSNLITLKSHWRQYLALAVIFTGFSIPLLPQKPFTLLETGQQIKLLFAALYAFASWSWIFAIIGAGMKFFDRESPARRYIADASYWVYLTHLPVIFFLQTLLMDLPFHWTVKFPVIIAVTLLITFWTYEHWVRYTFIGTALNGPRYRTADDKTPAVH